MGAGRAVLMGDLTCDFRCRSIVTDDSLVDNGTSVIVNDVHKLA